MDLGPVPYAGEVFRDSEQCTWLSVPRMRMICSSSGACSCATPAQCSMGTARCCMGSEPFLREFTSRVCTKVRMKNPRRAKADEAHWVSSNSLNTTHVRRYKIQARRLLITCILSAYCRRWRTLLSTGGRHSIPSGAAPYPHPPVPCI